MTKYFGRELVVEWDPAGSPSTFIDISGKSRTFEVQEQGASIDASTRDSTSREELTDSRLTTRTATLEGLDTRGTPTWDSTDTQIGVAGTLRWFPEGKIASGRVRTASAIIRNRQFSSPHDNVVTWRLEFNLTSEITYTTHSLT